MGFPRYSLWGERRVPGSQQGPRGTPHSSGLCLGTRHNSSTTQAHLASTVPVSAGATHPRGFQCSGTEPGAIPVSSHPSPAPCASVAACAVPRGLQAGHCVQGPCAACPGHPSSTWVMLCPRQDALVPRAGGCQEARASHRKPAGAGAARRPGRMPSSVRSRQPGQHVPSARAHAAGRGEACRGTARSACTVPRLSPPRAAGTAHDTGCCGGVRLQLRAPAELSQAWDNKEHSGL